jgi:hypothetical protein
MSIASLSSRIQSNVNTPVAWYGYSLQPDPPRTIVYNGQPLTRFLQENQANPLSYRAFLTANRIARIQDLQVGMAVKLPAVTDQTFSRHPNA